MRSGVLVTVTASWRVQPVDPLGRVGSATSYQPGSACGAVSEPAPTMAKVVGAPTAVVGPMSSRSASVDGSA